MVTITNQNSGRTPIGEESFSHTFQRYATLSGPTIGYTSVDYNNLSFCIISMKVMEAHSIYQISYMVKHIKYIIV